MKILITGNMGYIGPVVARHFRSRFEDAKIVGFDTAFFASCLVDKTTFPESVLNVQHFGDIRKVDSGILEGVDAIIHLAAISNDPMGKAFEMVTDEINHKASVAFAGLASKCGVKAFVFASSCSVYGAAGEEPRTESSELNPLTAYARSKVETERGLESFASTSFKVTCLRFSTACGFSPRLRLDLVLNDFVASAIAVGSINILSDGTPWRPLIDVRDMALAMEWGVTRPAGAGGNYLVLNVGSNAANYQVVELAEAVKRHIPTVKIEINRHGQPDRRSYKVNFDLFAKLAPNYVPKRSLDDSVGSLVSELTSISFNDGNFRSSNLVRLNVLQSLKDSHLLDDQLYPIQKEIS